MIRINLLKVPTKKTKKRKAVSPKITIVFGSIVLVVALLGAAWKFKNILLPAKPEVAEQKTYDVKPERTPSTYTKQNIVEETVHEVSDARQQLSNAGLLTLPYADLSFLEKINYEILFAKNIVDLLGKAVPEGIGLQSVEIDNFKTLYAVGFGPSRERIEQTLLAIKKNNIELLPPPFSFIKPHDKQSLKFAFTCKPEFGLNLTEPVIDAPFSSNEQLDSVLTAFGITAKECSISITKPLSQVSADKVGGFYRYVYKWSGIGTYKDFVQLVYRLYHDNSKYAFKQFSLLASSGTVIKIESQIIVTTRR